MWYRGTVRRDRSLVPGSGGMVFGVHSQVNEPIKKKNSNVVRRMREEACHGFSELGGCFFVVLLKEANLGFFGVW